MITQFATEKHELQEEINAVVAEHNEAMIVAESEKQQELSVKESEKARFQEQYNNSQRELKSTLVNLDRVKRDGAAKAEQDREAMNRLTAEIKNFKEWIYFVQTRVQWTSLSGSIQIRLVHVGLVSV